ncbi:hypothetical protein ACEWPN_04635 [Yoonia sp. R2-816]
MDAIGVYLRDAECARAVIEAFPDFTLADALDCRAYSSPHHGQAWGGSELFGVCNLYSMMKGQAAIRALFDELKDVTGRLPPLIDRSRCCGRNPQSRRSLHLRDLDLG